MPRFKIDENLPQEAASIFVTAGYDAVSVFDQQMGGEPDFEVAAVCRTEGRAVVTLDLDFADIRNYPPADDDGLIVLRLKSADKRHVLRVLFQLLSVITVEQLTGRLWIVDESSVRIRE